MSEAPTAKPLPRTNKLQSIECIRFLSAVSVIMWHYQAYFSIKREELPWPQVCGLFYNSGFLAVEWFWVLSGFVFFFNYRDLLHSRCLTGAEFFSRRIARLYPLHLATLLVVSGLLLLWSGLFGSEFHLYTDGVTPWIFISHFFMASNWATTRYTLNGPVWSVSVEVLVYVLFFILTKYCHVIGIVRTASVAIVCGVSYHLAGRLALGTPTWIAECATCFYLGGTAYEIGRRYIVDAFQGKKQILFWGGLAAAVSALYWFRPNDTVRFLIPGSVVMFVASSDMIEKSRFVARVARVGNWTYSSYLLHFPLALLILIAFRLAGADIVGVAKHPIFFVVYFVAVFGFADLCYTFFESPMRRMLRLFPMKRGMFNKWPKSLS